MTEPGEVTHLLQDVRRGDRDAIDRLFTLVYEDLKRRARLQLGGGSHTLDTTTLVHEAYVKLSASAKTDWQDGRHFFRVAARAMRQIIVDRARRHLAQKRGGGIVHEALELQGLEVDDPSLAAETLLALDDALLRLAVENERSAQVVELRYFGGLSAEETAATLEISVRTVKRDWRLARAFLHDQLSGGGRTE